MSPASTRITPPGSSMASTTTSRRQKSSTITDHLHDGMILRGDDQSEFPVRYDRPGSHSARLKEAAAGRYAQSVLFRRADRARTGPQRRSCRPGISRRDRRRICRTVLSGVLLGVVPRAEIDLGRVPRCMASDGRRSYAWHQHRHLDGQQHVRRRPRHKRRPGERGETSELELRDAHQRTDRIHVDFGVESEVNYSLLHNNRELLSASSRLRSWSTARSRISPSRSSFTSAPRAIPTDIRIWCSTRCSSRWRRRSRFR